jgi:hypothetical protein
MRDYYPDREWMVGLFITLFLRKNQRILFVI